MENNTELICLRSQVYPNNFPDPIILERDNLTHVISEMDVVMVKDKLLRV